MTECFRPPPQDPERIQAEFLLEVALQSFAGGNYKAALARLQLCKTHLLRVAEGEGEEKGKQPGADIAVQLGAVCGSQVCNPCHPSHSNPITPSPHIHSCSSDMERTVLAEEIVHIHFSPVKTPSPSSGSKSRW